MPTLGYLYNGDNIYAEYSSWTTPLASYTHGPGIDDALTDTGLIYYRARYYDPSVGRFTQRDPSKFGGGINMYTYVGNPLVYTDPTGLAFCTNFSGSCGGSNTGYGFGGTSGRTNTATTTGGDVTTSTTNGVPNGATSSSSVPVGNTTTSANPLVAAMISSSTGTPSSSASASGGGSISRAPGFGSIAARLLPALAPAAVPAAGWVLAGIGLAYTGWDIYRELTSARPIEGADDPGRMMYHYTGRALIGALRVDSYITPFGFLSSTNAIELLALDSARNPATLMYSFIVFPGQYRTAYNSIPGTNTVATANGQLGGGIEFQNTVPLTPLPGVYYTTP